MKKYIKNVFNYLKQYIQVQLFITLMSAPVLIWWGMPLSLMSLVGNLIFSPIIIAFLTLSSLLFITELASLPNHYLVLLLEKTTTAMTTLLACGSKKWLIAFPKLNIILLLAIPLITIALIFHPRIKTSSLRIMGTMSCILFVIFIYGYGTRVFAKSHSVTVPFTNDKLTINACENGRLTLHDEGAFNRKTNPESYVNFELKPYIHQNYGTVTITELTLDKMSMRSLRAALALCSTLNITHATLKKGTNVINKQTWRLYYKLKEMLENRVRLI